MSDKNATPSPGSTTPGQQPAPLSASPGSNVHLSPSASSSSSSNNHKRHSSVVEMLSTPPPLNERRMSSASRDSDDSSTASSGTVTTRDWQQVPLSELVEREKLIFVDADTSVEKAFDILEKRHLTSLPIRYPNESREPPAERSSTLQSMGVGSVQVDGVSHTFDYADLCSYLLLVLGHIEPINPSDEVKEQIALARQGREVPVRFVTQLGTTEPFITVPSSATLLTAAEILGNGVHRIAITDAKDGSELEGMLSQRRLIRYIWENGRLFKSLEPLFQTSLKELGVGSTNIITINGDELVIDAVQKMHGEGVSSLAVVDANNMLLGNISIVDVRLLTKSSQSSLLKNTCKQFLTVILSNRGLVDGKDSFPIFHVTAESTLGRTIAKLVATNAHRLWIVQPPKDGQSFMGGVGGVLTGVVSLTDIIYLLAKRAGKDSLDPYSARRNRRRSSSSSVRPSVEMLRRNSSNHDRRASLDRK